MGGGEKYTVFVKLMFLEREELYGSRQNVPLTVDVVAVVSEPLE